MAEGCQTNPEYFAGSTSNMADAWWEDLKLGEDMERYVRQGYKSEEALNFLKRDFPMHPWSIRSLTDVCDVSKSTTIIQRFPWKKSKMQ